MNKHEVTHARGDQESQAIREGIAEATNHDGGPWEYGHYVERYDGPYVKGMVPRGPTADEDWTPLIYEAVSLEDAEELHHLHRLDTGMTGPFRNSRVVRRAVSPWEVVA
jgi:hypothetical protein